MREHTRQDTAVGPGRREARGGDARLAELKKRIAKGEFETPEKLDLTVRRLIEDLRGAGARKRPE